MAEETVDPAVARVTRLHRVVEGGKLRRTDGPGPALQSGTAAGCVHAQFTVLDTLAAVHRVGIFAIPRTFEAWVRFANASSQSDREKDVRGMAIRLSGVPGQNLTPGETRQDFVLNSHPVMVAANTKDFLELLKAMDAAFQQGATSLASAIAMTVPGGNADSHWLSLLERDAVSVRSRQRREIHRASVCAAEEYSAGACHRHLSE